MPLMSRMPACLSWSLVNLFDFEERDRPVVFFDLDDLRIRVFLGIGRLLRCDGSDWRWLSCGVACFVIPTRLDGAWHLVGVAEWLRHGEGFERSHGLE